MFITLPVRDMKIEIGIEVFEPHLQINLYIEYPKNSKNKVYLGIKIKYKLCATFQSLKTLTF